MTNSIDIPWDAIVRQVDPNFNKDVRHQIEYEFSRRKFYSDPTTRGPYIQYPYEFDESFGLSFATREAARQW